MDPIGPGVVELPVSVAVHLLKTDVGAHAHVYRDGVALHVWKMIGGAWEVRRFAVGGKSRARNVVAGAHLLQNGRVLRQDCAELGMTILPPLWVHRWYSQIVDHPALVPSAF